MSNTKSSPEDIFYYPCGTWCYREHFREGDSDDYIVLKEGAREYDLFLAEQEEAVREKDTISDEVITIARLL